MSATERYYDQNAEAEWSRLDRHRLEFAVTQRILKDYLPPPPASVLDIGGGPGRYSILLAQRAYRVTLVDLSKSCLDFAKAKAREANVQLEGFLHANATNLSSLENESFDVALLFGPLYHLIHLDDRKRAIREARRILKRNGVMFATLITRYAPVRWTARYEPVSQDNLERSQQVLQTGMWTGRVDAYKFGQADAYFVRPSEIRPLMEAEGFQTLGLIGCEPAASMVEEGISELSGEMFGTWVEINYNLGKDPDALGASEHLVYIGKRPPR